MPAYCTVDDLKARVPERVLISLTDDEGDGPVSLQPVQLARIDEAIAAAGNLVDAYAQARYPVPFDPVPGVIRDKALDIALYKLFGRRGFEQNSPDETIQDQYRSAERFLQDLAKGLVALGGSPAPPPPSGVEISGQDRRFSRDRLKDW